MPPKKNKTKPVPKQDNGEALTAPPKKNKVVKKETDPTNPYSKKPYIVVTLCTGEQKSFTSHQEANDFSGEHQDVISATQHFDSKAKMDAFLSAAPIQVDPEVEVINVATMSPEDKSKFNAMRAAIDETRPMHTLNVDFKVTKSSPVAVFVITANDNKGEPMWFWKSPVDKVLVEHFRNCPTDSAFTNDFMTNLKLVTKRDPNKGANDPYVNVRKKDNREFPVHLLYTWVNIPVQDFNTAKEEATWLQEQANIAVMHLRTAQRTPLFMGVVQESFTENMFKAMMKENVYGPNFSQFVQKCKISAKPIENLNKYVILDDSKMIQLFLIKNELKDRKYPTDVPTPSHAPVPIKTEQESETSPSTVTKRKTNPKSQNTTVTKKIKSNRTVAAASTPATAVTEKGTKRVTPDKDDSSTTVEVTAVVLADDHDDLDCDVMALPTQNTDGEETIGAEDTDDDDDD